MPRTERWSDGRPKSFTITVKLPPPHKYKPLARRGQIGVKSQLTLSEFITVLLELNDQLPPHKRLTDLQIIDQLAQEFPKSHVAYRLVQGKKSLGYLRSLYNMGRFSPDKTPPPIKSIPYGHDGWPINPWSGRPMTAKRAANFVDAHGYRLGVSARLRKIAEDNMEGVK